MQSHCQIQDENEGNSKEDRQERGLSVGAQLSQGPLLKTHLKEGSVTNLSDTSKTNTRYELVQSVQTGNRVTVFTSCRKNKCNWIALGVILRGPRLVLQIQRDD